MVRQAASSGLFGSAQLVVGHVGDEAAEWSFLLEQRAAELVVEREVTQDVLERNLEQHIEGGQHAGGEGAVGRRRVDVPCRQLTHAPPHESGGQLLLRRLPFAQISRSDTQLWRRRQPTITDASRTDRTVRRIPPAAPTLASCSSWRVMTGSLRTMSSSSETGHSVSRRCAAMRNCDSRPGSRARPGMRQGCANK